MEIPARVPDKLTPRVDFPPEEFRKHIYTKGLRLIWEQTSECPCQRSGPADMVPAASSMTDLLVTEAVTSRTGEAKAECPTCRGNGYFHHSAQRVIGIVTRVGADPKGFPGWGEWTKGISYITTLPEHVPAYQDRFTMVDSVLIYRETRRRGVTGSPENLRYPIVTRVLDTTPPMSVDVLYCCKVDTLGALPVDPATEKVPANPIKEMVKGRDFNVVDGKIEWLDSGDPPPPEQWYSVAYYANPRYHVLDIPHAFRDTWIGTKVVDPYFEPMPVNCLCQMEFLARREDEEPGGE